MDVFNGTLAALTAALVVAGPVSVAVSKVVDFIRNLFDASGTAPRFVWNIVAFVVGLGLCLGWGINVMAAVVNSIPALATNTMLAGTAGTILTGLLVGAMAGFWHDKMKQWSGSVPDPDHTV